MKSLYSKGGYKYKSHPNIYIRSEGRGQGRVGRGKGAEKAA